MFLNFFFRGGGGGAGFNYLMPHYKKTFRNYDITTVRATAKNNEKLYSNLSFPQTFYVLTFLIGMEVSAEIMRKYLSAESRDGKLSYILMFSERHKSVVKV